MLNKSASGVLASLRGSTYRSVRLASSLAAALLDGLFEHPDVMLACAPHEQFPPSCWHQPSFSASCWRYREALTIMELWFAEVPWGEAKKDWKR
jgi:hypothetical protein